MDRDAPQVPLRFNELVPPPDVRHVQRVGALGFGLVAAAAILGVLSGAIGPDAPWILSTLRLWLVGIGVAIAGYAISLRPSLPTAWLIAAAAGFLAGGLPPSFPTRGIGLVGVPNSWDSGQFMLRVLAGVAVIGAGFAAMSYTWRLRVASVMIPVHFFGIFLATTSPSTQGNPPYWVTDQIFNRVYMPYVQFVYLRNAYHFYSPEPGDASLLAFLLKTEDGEEEVNGIRQTKYKKRWVVMPRRPTDMKDPLGVSYFRRLSITEQAAAPGGQTSGVESNEVLQRRMMATYEESPGIQRRIVINPLEANSMQFRLPSPITYRYLLPSYAKHMIYEETPENEMAKTSVMIYRLEHKAMNVLEAKDGVAPYSPGSYRVYYLGDYDIEGHLRDPKDPMLYWQVPVFPRNGRMTDPNPDLYEDYLSRHAGLTFDWSSLR